MSASTRRASCRWIPLASLILLVTVVAAARSLAAPGAPFPAFVPTPGVTPEGVAVDRTGNVYVSVRDGGRGLIWKFTPDGAMSRFADVGAGTIGGLAVTATGHLYAAMATGADQGVFRIDERGTLELLPGTGQIVFANALAFDRRGVLYITESFSIDSSGGYGEGGIWRITPAGEAELWLRHPLLTGIGAVLGYPVGANGIGLCHGDLYVVNTDKGLVVRIPVRPDGGPGQPEIWAALTEVAGSPMAGSPFPLMADGLALDVFGNVYVTVISRNAVVRIDAEDRAQSTVAVLGPPASDSIPRAPFDTPASLAFGTGSGNQQQLFVTNLGWMATIVPGPAWPGPGLVKIGAGAPGLPLVGAALPPRPYNLGSWNAPGLAPLSALATGSSNRRWIGSLADR